MSNAELRIRIAQSLTEIDTAAWNSCACEPIAGDPKAPHEFKLISEDNSCPELSTRGQSPNPFVSHEFLSSLEESRSVGGRTGWQPRHLLAEDGQGGLLGTAPCYVKTHSRGEYVFDHGWAEAFE